VVVKILVEALEDIFFGEAQLAYLMHNFRVPLLVEIFKGMSGFCSRFSVLAVDPLYANFFFILLLLLFLILLLVVRVLVVDAIVKVLVVVLFVLSVPLSNSHMVSDHYVFFLY